MILPKRLGNKMVINGFKRTILDGFSVGILRESIMPNLRSRKMQVLIGVIGGLIVGAVFWFSLEWLESIRF